MKRYFSTFLAVIFLISSLGNNVVLAQGILSGSQELTWSLETEQEKEYQSNSDSEDENDQEDSEDSEEDSEEGGEEPEDPGDDEEDPEEPEEDLTTDAAVSGLTVNYDESQDAIILSYRLSGTVSYVNILMDGRPIEEEYSGIYTSYSYDLLEDAEGKEYTFQIVPFEERRVSGAVVDIPGTSSESKKYAVPYKKADLYGMDVEYNLEKQLLTIEWYGDNIKDVDIYQDGVLLAKKVSGDSYSTTTALKPSSEHTYKIIPYNKKGEAGAAQTAELEVEDYTAVIDELEVEYLEKEQQVVVKWSGTYVKYVDIYINDQVLVENYVKGEYRFKYVPQAGASYIITVYPYSENGNEGNQQEEELMLGDFEVPSIGKLEETTCYETDTKQHYTGFTKPAVNVQWMADANACYEIYRATKDKKMSYIWIGSVKAVKNGVISYLDKSARVGNNYYKIRRVIKEDSYIDQEVATALSESAEIFIELPKPQIHAELTEEGSISLSMKAKKEIVSGYAIYRKVKNGTYRKIAEVAEDTYLDQNIVFGNQYTYKVKAYFYDTKEKKKYYSEFSGTAKVKNAIGNFTAQVQQLSKKKARISWQAAPNAEGYEVYYKSKTQGDAYRLLKVTSRLHVDATLKSGVKYSFLIKAYRNTEDGKFYFSNTETELKMGFTGPGNFRIASTRFAYDKAKKLLIRNDKLAWDKVYGAKGYYIDVYNPTTKKYEVLAKVKGVNNTSYVVSNTLPATVETVTYRIRSYMKERTQNGETVEVNLQIGKVSKVKVSKVGKAASVSWNKVKGAESYRIYRSNGRNKVLVGTTDKLKFTDKGLSVGVVYTYYVQAVSDTLKSTGACSDPVTYTRKLSKISWLSVLNSRNKEVQLAWSPVEEADGYMIYYRESTSSRYKKLAKVSGSKSTYTHMNLKAGTTYSYKVFAYKVNAGGVKIKSKGVVIKAMAEK